MKSVSQLLLLGIPFDNLTLASAVDRILNLARQYKQLGDAKLVATVNVDFLTNALAWRSGIPPRHPELLEILRQADLVTADGMPLVWLSKMLNLPLKERVAGADLVPALAKAAAISGQRLFLLGGKGYVAQKAAEKLQKQFPQLNIAGVYAPFVYSEGEQMLDSDQDDEKIVDYINQSEVDILLIGFGNPKQELFFQRNRHRLEVGVAVGVGGTFEFITGRVARAPRWMQKSGLEWLFRITQDPVRLWKRYAIGLIKLGFIAVPMVIFNKISDYLNSTDKTVLGNKNMPLLMNDKNAIQMPIYSQGEIFPNNWIENVFYQRIKNPQNNTICFDFSRTQEIDLQALANFIRVLKNLYQKGFEVSFTGLQNKSLIQTLKVSRVWDIFSQNQIIAKLSASQNDTISQFQEHPVKEKNALLSIDSQQQELTIAAMHGRLDANWVNRVNLDECLAGLGDRDAILDLSKLQFVDSTGLRVFFKIKQQFSKQNTRLILCAVNETIMQLISITKIDDLFQISKNIDEAKNLLNKVDSH